MFCTNMSSSSSITSSVEDERSKNSVIAVCQMTSTSDLEANIKTCKDLIVRAKSRGAKVNQILS